MNILLFDDPEVWTNLLPLTFTRPVSALQVGHFTIAEKYENHFQATISYKTESYLQEKFPCREAEYKINSSYLPDAQLIDAITQLKDNEVLRYKNNILAYKNEEALLQGVDISYPHELHQIRNPWDIFTYNEIEIEKDFAYFISNKVRIQPDSSNFILQDENIFVEAGATITHASLNPLGKKMIIAQGAEIMEGTHVRGALSMGALSQTKLLTKIYGATSIGAGSKVGGELNNVVMMRQSNKAHDGFLGNAVIGEWCNLGADTNNSNLKNNYAEVKLWSYPHKKFVPTQLQFCGLIMGDHSKCGINTMFNTGTVVGICCNIFGAGFPRNFLPDFSWGGAQGMTTYRLEDAFDTIQKVLARRHMQLSEVDRTILTHVFELSAEHRK